MCALVTGVQTCALPILARGRQAERPKGTGAERRRHHGSHGDHRSGQGDRATADTDRILWQLRRIHDETVLRSILPRVECARPQHDLLWNTRRRRTGPCMARSEEHTSELQSLMRISYAVFCLKKNKK